MIAGLQNEGVAVHGLQPVTGVWAQGLCDIGEGMDPRAHVFAFLDVLVVFQLSECLLLSLVDGTVLLFFYFTRQRQSTCWFCW